jgi:hypothetical protein
MRRTAIERNNTDYQKKFIHWYKEEKELLAAAEAAHAATPRCADDIHHAGAK